MAWGTDRVTKLAEAARAPGRLPPRRRDHFDAVRPGAAALVSVH